MRVGRYVLGAVVAAALAFIALSAMAGEAKPARRVPCFVLTLQAPEFAGRPTYLTNQCTGRVWSLMVLDRRDAAGKPVMGADGKVQVDEGWHALPALPREGK